MVKEPNKIPLTNSPRTKEPTKIPLKSNTIIEDTWERFDLKDGSVVFAKKYEDHSENNPQSIQQLESDQIN